ncbi:hypothetical protein TNCV_4292781 [Trichonephila clavipes]|uniref:Uncharacterized protein n=1 Tax=Trichonephila clavipes TaxID=2585209 RepID=A0A8X6V4J0_TRICX|nr:hypothetical protein TNCV_4292781 [Trichonephila clavipes]
MWFPHFRHVQRAMNINSYTSDELAEIHFIYGPVNGNERFAVRFHGGKISNEATTESLSVRSGSSVPGGTWIFQSYD